MLADIDDVWDVIQGAAKPIAQWFPADLAMVTVFLALVNLAVFVPGIRETPLRIPLGVVFFLFVPGYALVAALFPAAGGGETRSVRGHGPAARFLASSPRIDGIERITLSIGLSIVVVPFVGLVANFSPWGLRLIPVMVGTSAFVLLMLVTAAIRRQAIPREERFQLPYRHWVRGIREGLFEPGNRLDVAVTIMLGASLVAALLTIGVVVMSPPPGEEFTRFYVLSEAEDDAPVAAEYPTELVVGQTEELLIGVENREHRPVNYTIIVKLQIVDIEADPDTDATDVTPVQSTELGRLELSLGHNETVHQSVEFRTDNETFSGDQRRLELLLYADHDREVPDQPSSRSAYRDLHLWVDVAR